MVRKLIRLRWLALFLASIASAGTFSIKLPMEKQVEKAVATTEKQPKTSIDGTISANVVSFSNPLSGSAYEIQLTLKDGTVLQGVDMGWYGRVMDKPDAGELTDDDRQQMTAVFTAGAQFFNVQQAMLIKGTHNRAVMLVRLERDSAFHSDKGDEIIWRPELWYFENHHGGWEKVLQTDRVLRRERFETNAAYHAVVDKLRWVPELGGLKSTPKSPDVIVTLQEHAGIATDSAAPPPATQTADEPQP